MKYDSCDRCGATLGQPADCYKLTIAIRPAPGDRPGRDGVDDPVQAMAELLDEMEESGDYPALPAPGHRAEFNLCSACRARYAADPLGRNPGRGLRFSKN